MIPIQLEEIFTQTEGHLLVICAEAGSGLKKIINAERVFRFTCANKEISFLNRIHAVYRYSPPSLVRDQSISILLIPPTKLHRLLLFSERDWGEAGQQRKWMADRLE